MNPTSSIPVIRLSWMLMAELVLIVFRNNPTYGVYNRRFKKSVIQYLKKTYCKHIPQ